MKRRIVFVGFLLIVVLVFIRYRRPFVAIREYEDVTTYESLLAPYRAQLRNFPTDANVGQPGRKSMRLDPTMFGPLYARLDALLPGYRVSRVHAPVEYRVYFPGSSGMDWHKDQPIHNNKEYLEGVLTLHNDSDSVFEYLDLLGIRRVVVPRKGTLVLLKPNDAVHRVTPVRNRGSREILKIVFIRDNSTTACDSRP
jgi:hypothetical protein